MFYIKNIKMINYRCFINENIDFKNNINIIVGPNAVGKTSIVEAVSYIANGKSFKNAKDCDTINKNSRFFSLVSECVSNSIEKRVVYCDESGKKLSKDGENYKKISLYYKETGVVSFSPDDLEIIKGSPIMRRRLIDSSLSQIDDIYYDKLIIYNKLLKERNEFLKGYVENEKNNIFLDVIDKKITEIGKYIIDARCSFISELSKNANNIMKLISNNKEELKLTYFPKVTSDKYDLELRSRRKHDIYLQNTSYGPHRDDINILINDYVAATNGSQGQIRSAIIAIKIGFFEILKAKKEKIIVILDDVLSELDSNRQNEMLKLLNKDNQMFITCTSLEAISKDIIDLSNIIDVRKEE